MDAVLRDLWPLHLVSICSSRSNLNSSSENCILSYMWCSGTFGPSALWVCSSGSNLDSSTEKFYFILFYMQYSRTFGPFALWVCSSGSNLNSPSENCILSYFILYVVLWDLWPLCLTKLLAVLIHLNVVLQDLLHFCLVRI